MAKDTRKSRVHVTLLLTATQADELLNYHAAESRPYLPLTQALRKILATAIAKALAEAAETDADIARRTRPCRACGTVVTFSARGLQMAPNHNCPHGRECGAYGLAKHCSQCRKARPRKSEPAGPGLDAVRDDIETLPVTDAGRAALRGES